MITTLEKEFDSLKNKCELCDCSPSSARKVWWKCSVDPRHEWEARVFSRTKQNAGCPYCAGKKVLPEDSLKERFPYLAKEWDYDSNKGSDPSEIHCRSGKKFWWSCERGHKWIASVTHRTHGGRNGQGTGCPFCSNQRVCDDNCVLAVFPKSVSSQWNHLRNSGITMLDLVANSRKKVWWKCNAADDHEWQASPYERLTLQSGCPCCSGRKVVRSNCLTTTHPQIVKEWHPTKNEINPTEVTYASNRKVWWRCLNDAAHEWNCKVYTRTRGDQCPFCAASKGEKLIKEWLESNGINFATEYRISDCRNKRPLPFDFAVFDESGGLSLLIEYQGRHHYQEIGYFGGKERLEYTISNDRIKEKYCSDKGISLLAIPYSEIGCIEDILRSRVTTN